MSTLAMQSTPTQIFIDRPPTPRPCFVVRAPPNISSYHSLHAHSPDLRSYSSFSPVSNPSSPSYDINVISPSVASFYSDRDEHSSAGFRSPKLALQTSNLLGLDWQERDDEQETYTPISEPCTPISPSTSYSHNIDDFAAAQALCSSRLELLTSDFLHSVLHDDPDALYTPISPSASDDQDSDDWPPSLATHDEQPPRLALLTQGYFQPDTWAFHTPLTPPEAAQQFEEDLSRGSARIYTHSYNQSRHASELYTPISPSPHEYTNKFAFQPRDLDRVHSGQSADLTPISASTAVEQGWKDLLSELMTPAERFFVPDFDIERVSAPAPLEVETRESWPVIEEYDPTPCISPHDAMVSVPATHDSEPRPRSRKPRSASLSSMPEDVVALRRNTQNRRRHSIAVLDSATRQILNEGTLLTDSVFEMPDSQLFDHRPQSPRPLALNLDFEPVKKPRRHSFSVLDKKLRDEICQAVVLTPAVYVTESRD